MWVEDGRSGQRVRRPQPLFDVRYRIDEFEFRYGFEQKGWAETFAQQLHEGFARGALFDPAARRFVVSENSSTGDPELTVYAHFVDYLRRKWRVWEPANRPHAQRDLARACIFLVHEDAPCLSPIERVDDDRFLRQVALDVHAPTSLTDEQQRWHRWFESWSLLLGAVTDQHLQAFLEEVGSSTLEGERRELGGP